MSFLKKPQTICVFVFSYSVMYSIHGNGVRWRWTWPAQSYLSNFEDRIVSVTNWMTMFPSFYFKVEKNYQGLDIPSDSPEEEVY